ncbi:NAD-dependent epimerase/dehydratase family protein [Streptomyces montanus]|uniref:NAD-dependent epimerase/dehydratase family protein n=1 Tax=Streptomyces montanus TaxID=2580423 RepID=A0A5R9FKJ9_9ACTN|nr:NAD(P)H-binding protein [Streptomyces montanus]TLS41363.1 NAD-dependent epimerase/dehydratase family protein [Streptomyces montanus]
MILVTGATGTIGSHVVRLLTDRGVPFRAMSRRERPGGVRADFDDPASLAGAVAGVDTVFLVTVPPVPTADHDIDLITAARAAGVRKIVKLSAIGSGKLFDGATVGEWHVAAEEAIEASGLVWTMLRPPSFASNFLRYRALIQAGEPIPNLTGDSRQAIVDPRDVAAVAVAAMTSDAHDGQRYDLTGPKLLTFTDQAAILERVLERLVKIIDVSALDQLPTGMITGISWARAGGAAYVTDDVLRVLGRPAGTFEEWARDHQEALAAMP